MRSVFSPNAGKYGPEKNPYLDTFNAVNLKASFHALTISWLNLDTHCVDYLHGMSFSIFALNLLAT